MKMLMCKLNARREENGEPIYRERVIGVHAFLHRAKSVTILLLINCNGGVLAVTSLCKAGVAMTLLSCHDPP